MDHADCILRHEIEAGTFDTDGQRHSTKVAWRALAQLQEELEAAYGLPLPRNARGPGAPTPPYVAKAAILGDVSASAVMMRTYAGAPMPIAEEIREEVRRMAQEQQEGFKAYKDYQEKAQQQAAAAEPPMWRDEADGSRTNISAYTSNGQPKPLQEVKASGGVGGSALGTVVYNYK